MPLRFSTLYRKTKPPVEISLILGCGGRNSASPEPKRSPAAPPENLEGGTEQKFPFPFLNFLGGEAKKKNVGRNFFGGGPGVGGGGGGGGAGHCPSKKVRAKDII